MNSLQLWCALRSNHSTNKCFVGIFSKDTLPKIDKLKRPKSLIICNTDESFKDGSHWIAIFIDFQLNCVDFFDSLGKNANHYGVEFSQFLNLIPFENVRFVDRRIQPPKTDVCGEFCLYYSAARCKGSNLHSIINNAPSSQTLKMNVSQLFTFLEDFNFTSKNCNQSCVCCGVK